MNIEDVLNAAKVASELSTMAFRPGEDEKKRMQMGAVLLLAQSYLVEYAHHLSNCHDRDEALSATARGTMPISASKVDLLRAVGWKI